MDERHICRNMVLNGTYHRLRWGFFVFQNLPYQFNKASLMNIGYLEAKKLFLMDCVLFHDVDTLIERDDNLVICGDNPVHHAAYADRHKYK